MTMGQRIKHARELKQMTQEEVAKLCETTKQTIFKYETGKVTNIPYDKIELLAKALSVNPAFLFGWEEQKEQPTVLDGLSLDNLSDLQKIIIAEVIRMPEDRLAALAKLLGV